MTTAPRFDLQSHSRHSDGELAPAEVVDAAAAAGSVSPPGVSTARSASTSPIPLSRQRRSSVPARAEACCALAPQTSTGPATGSCPALRAFSLYGFTPQLGEIANP